MFPQIWKVPWFITFFCPMKIETHVTDHFTAEHVIQGNENPNAQATITHVYLRLNSLILSAVRTMFCSGAEPGILLPAFESAPGASLPPCRQKEKAQAPGYPKVHLQPTPFLALPCFLGLVLSLLIVFDHLFT